MKENNSNVFMILLIAARTIYKELCTEFSNFLTLDKNELK